MEIRKKQNLIVIVVIIFIVAGFSLSNYIKQQKVYVLSYEEKEHITNEGSQNITRNEVHTEKIVVHIEGEVVNPGVYELEKDARVFDAIDAAGGLLEKANRKRINLAKRIVDEEYIYIPNENDEDAEFQNTNNLSTITNVNQNTSLININKANITELKTLPGIGDVLANRIIEYRSEKGEFKSIEDLKNVSGIGDKKFSDIKDKVTVR